MRASVDGERSVVCPASLDLFDYAAMSPSVTTFLKGQAERIRRYAGKCIITIGKDLISAKHYLSHGAFIRWVESEVGIPARTAQGYMKAAEWAANKSAIVAHLPPSVLYLLSGSTTPKAFADEILRRVEAGERLALPAVRGELRLLLANRRSTQPADDDNQSQNSDYDVETEIIAPDVEVQCALAEAIRIMARGLCKAHFERIRELMTNRRLLDRTDLAQHIANAFLELESARPEPVAPRYQVKVVGQDAGNGYLNATA